MGINLNDPNDVMRGVNSLFGKIKPFVGIALPLLQKVSPKIKEATGYSVDELYGALNSRGAENPPGHTSPKANRRDKYRGL